MEKLSVLKDISRVFNCVHYLRGTVDVTNKMRYLPTKLNDTTLDVFKTKLGRLWNKGGVRVTDMFGQLTLSYSGDNAEVDSVVIEYDSGFLHTLTL